MRDMQAVVLGSPWAKLRMREGTAASDDLASLNNLDVGTHRFHMTNHQILEILGTLWRMLSGSGFGW